VTIVPHSFHLVAVIYKRLEIHIGPTDQLMLHEELLHTCCNFQQYCQQISTVFDAPLVAPN
jgi:hypothetical protein